MTRFRSLLYHEFQLSKKGIIIRLGLLMLWAGFMWAVMLSIAANGQDLTALSGVEEAMIVITALVCVTASLVMDDVFKADLYSGWLIYSYALPVTPFERAAVRFARRFMMCAVGMAFSLINTAAMCALVKAPFGYKYIAEHIIVLDALLLFCIIEHFFTLSARNSDDLKKAAIRSDFVTFGIYAVVGVIFFVNFDIKDPEGIKLPEIGSGSLVWALTLMILLAATSFAITYRRLSRAFDTGMRIDKYKSAETKGTEEIKRTSGGMTGLLYKECKQNGRMLILTIVVPFLVTLFPLCVTMPFIGKEEAIRLALEPVMRLLMMCIGLFIVNGMMSELFRGDDKKLWAYFVVSNPKGVKGFMYYKYVLVFAMNGLYMAAGIFADALLTTMSYFATGKAASGMMNMYIAVFYLLLFLCAVDIPFIIRFGVRKGSFIKTGMMLAICTIIVVGFAILPENIGDNLIRTVSAVSEDKADSTLMLFISLCPYIALAAFVGSYRFSCKIFMKGVTEYDG